MSMRIGQGVDTHQFTEGRPLILGGVTIPHSHGLLGHSDADALTHAIIDALLGALALGNIGMHFPDTDPAYKDANSLDLLHHTVSLMKEKGYLITNIDSTIITEAPKITPHIPKMIETLAPILDIRTDQLSIKATRSEQMGFIGRGEGLTAHAICLLQKS